MVSIVIPTYNRESWLANAIDSVKQQSFRDWELVIVDDGSSDQSSNVVQELTDSRITYVRVEHGGVSRARNLGVSLTRFPWVCFLDSDDQWTPAKLQRQIETVEEFPEFRIVYTNEIWIRRGKRVNQKKKHRKFGGWIYHRCLPLCIISPSSVMLHRELLEKEGLFDESYTVCEDYELWLRISARNPVFFLDEPLIIKFGGHDDQLSRSTWGLDVYRVRALLKALRSGNLTPAQQIITERELVTKAQILVSGFRKRHNLSEAEKYETLIRTWTAES
jgi:glycosyltransferase involved in cell wall biosynthesis